MAGSRGELVVGGREADSTTGWEGRVGQGTRRPRRDDDGLEMRPPPLWLGDVQSPRPPARQGGARALAGAIAGACARQREHARHHEEGELRPTAGHGDASLFFWRPPWMDEDRGRGARTSAASSVARSSVGMRVATAAGKVGGSEASSAAHDGALLLRLVGEKTSLLERAELCVRDFFPCITQKLKWVLCLGLLCWRQS